MMLELSSRRPGPSASFTPAAAAAALARAADKIARLDQALAGHPLTPAFLHRARLEAVRRQAAVDGQAIDPWHLAAILEGFRLRMESALRIIDPGMIFEAARHALHQHQWLVTPDVDQKEEIQRAAAVLAEHAEHATPLLAAAQGVQAWIDAGGARPPLRAALIRHWVRHRLLRAPVPVTGPTALRPGTDWDAHTWPTTFLAALADDAEDHLLLLVDLERA